MSSKTIRLWKIILVCFLSLVTLRVTLYFVENRTVSDGADLNKDIAVFLALNENFSGDWYFLSQDNLSGYHLQLGFDEFTSRDEVYKNILDGKITFSLGEIEDGSVLPMEYVSLFSIQDKKIDLPLKLNDNVELVSFDGESLKLKMKYNGSIHEYQGFKSKENILQVISDNRTQLNSTPEYDYDDYDDEIGDNYDEQLTSVFAQAIIQRAYFYSSPNHNSKTKQFIIEGQIATIMEHESDFVKVYFEYNNKYVEGYLRLSDVVCFSPD